MFFSFFVESYFKTDIYTRMCVPPPFIATTYVFLDKEFSNHAGYSVSKPVLISLHIFLI
jgi:hypothetical protein